MLEKQIITEAEYRYIELGEGSPVVILHGLMGGLSNFRRGDGFISQKGYKILIPELPVYELPLINSSVKSLAEFLDGFLKLQKLKDVILLGNSGRSCRITICQVSPRNGQRTHHNREFGIIRKCNGRRVSQKR